MQPLASPRQAMTTGAPVDPAAVHRMVGAARDAGVAWKGTVAPAFDELIQSSDLVPRTRHVGPTAQADWWLTAASVQPGSPGHAAAAGARDVMRSWAEAHSGLKTDTAYRAGDAVRRTEDFALALDNLINGQPHKLIDPERGIRTQSRYLSSRHTASETAKSLDVGPIMPSTIKGGTTAGFEMLSDLAFVEATLARTAGWSGSDDAATAAPAAPAPVAPPARPHEPAAIDPAPSTDRITVTLPRGTAKAI